VTHLTPSFSAPEPDDQCDSSHCSGATRCVHRERHERLGAIDDHAGRRFSVHVDAALEAGSPAAVTFDILKFVEQVKAGGMPEAKAKAIAQAFRDAQREVDLATKKIPISKAYRIVCSRNVAGVGGLGE
jgi:hypothetical protein